MCDIEASSGVEDTHDDKRDSVHSTTRDVTSEITRDVTPKDVTPDARTNVDKQDTVSNRSSSSSLSGKPSSIVIVCEEDGLTWADFFKVKLTGKDYSFSTWIQQLGICDSVLVTEKTKTQIVLLTPTLLENEANADKLLSFCMDSCIFILLGVNENDVKTAFSEDNSADILRFPLHVIVEENIGDSLKEALVKIIKSYEKSDDDDDDDSPIYEILPMRKPVQVNKLVNVIPSNNLTGGSDIYLLLEHKADDIVNVVINTPGGKTIPATLVDTAVYTVTLPDETSGDVSLKVESEQRLLGQHKAQVSSKLEQLRSLLEDTSDPVSLMCQSLGIPRNSASLDKRLADQVKNNWPSHTMPFLMQIFEIQDHTEETSSEVWPTVLHFAAQYNLELFCTELMKYPGMVNAAAISNVRDQYPCEIAKEKGFTRLGEQLYSFVEKQGHHDSGVVIDSPPPCPGPGYINSPPAVKVDDSYLDMDTIDTSVLSHRFNSMGKVDGQGIRIPHKEIPSARKLLEDPELHHSASVPTCTPLESSPLVFENNSDSSDDYMVPNSDFEQPESLGELISNITKKPNKPTKTYSMREQRDVVGHRLLPPPPGMGQPFSPATDILTKPRSYSLGAEKTMEALERIQREDPSCCVPTLREETHGRSQKEISPRGEVKKTGRFSKFLNKFRRHDSDLTSKADYNKKTKSKQLNKNVNTGRKHSDTAGQPIELERDSGSYSDDDDRDVVSSTHSPGYHKKQGGKAMLKPPALSRKESVRVFRARNERMDNAPTLPLRPGRQQYH
ncbi:uncharacterized protein LOC121380196 isoform X2 [Gigantopelta aegis]|nr:uncharacterized protein LOC121380196 isoform X2 [Gigantopelta aegis]XP_041364940.1 uncharacterized protein LOC121380196 isoform X2 [Gigantopelta aegis]